MEEFVTSDQSSQQGRKGGDLLFFRRRLPGLSVVFREERLGILQLLSVRLAIQCSAPRELNLFGQRQGALVKPVSPVLRGRVNHGIIQKEQGLRRNSGPGTQRC